MEEAGARLYEALGFGVPAFDAAGWLEGFLSGSALFLIHDSRLFGRLDRWLRDLDERVFESNLPALRRTFASLEPPERHRLALRSRALPAEGEEDLDP